LWTWTTICEIAISDDKFMVYSVHNQKAIRPKKIIVTIDGKATSFESIMPINRYTSLLGRIIEVTGFAFLDDSAGSLVRLIASHPQKEIRIRLSGTGNVDFILSKKDHQIICEAVEFFNALQIVKKAGKP